MVGDLRQTGPVENRCRRDAEAGTHPLAAGEDQVAGDLGEESVVGLDRRQQAILDPFEVGGHRGQESER